MNLGYLVHKMGSVAFHSGTTVGDLIVPRGGIEGELFLTRKYPLRGYCLAPPGGGRG